ncbi:MAG: LuxR C-terminal-related transcriptional regulator [Rubrobacteraceae bacterium]|nr:response regulator transcription factor [Rubrobacteraceae bacterium]MCL6439508.1 LuxR C-terminal-related transcriptional regulator [Rubrobacteraceae bacterium]
MTEASPHIISHRDASPQRRSERERLVLSVLCGASSARTAFERELAARGFRVSPEARMKLLLDVPRAYAVRALEELDRSDSKVVVVTWNTCPEYVEDLRELRPDALLSDEFFLRQDLDDALLRVLSLVSADETYSFTPGPQTALTSSERAVLRYAAYGWNNRRISRKLCLSEQTVKNRLRSVYRKLGPCNHTQATLYYWGMCRYLRGLFRGQRGSGLGDHPGVERRVARRRLAGAFYRAFSGSTDYCRLPARSHRDGGYNSDRVVMV